MAFGADLMAGHDKEPAFLAMGRTPYDLHIMFPKLGVLPPFNRLSRRRGNGIYNITTAGYGIILLPICKQRDEEMKLGGYRKYGNIAVFSAFLTQCALVKI